MKSVNRKRISSSLSRIGDKIYYNFYQILAFLSFYRGNFFLSIQNQADVSPLIFSANGNPLNARDAETCTSLCASCDGTATFEDERCDCIVAEGSKQGVECVERINRETENVDRDSASTDHEIAARSPRCSLLGHRSRLGTGKRNLRKINNKK